jgi:hypothetical protein
MTASPTVAHRTQFDLAGAGGVLLGVLASCVGGGAGIGAAAGSTGLGLAIGAVVGVPASVAAVVLRYRKQV